MATLTISSFLLSGCGSKPAAGTAESNTQAVQQEARLNDIWVLVSLNETAINFETEAPYLEFHLDEKQVMGYGGCNRISAGMEISGDTIKFGPFMATRMACPDLDLESAFTAMLTEQAVTFALDGLQLTLTGKKGQAVFKKVD